MTTLSIRKKLADYMKVADEIKVKVYALLKDEIEQDKTEYSEEFKKELDQRYTYYKSGGKMVSAAEADKQINAIYTMVEDEIKETIVEYSAEFKAELDSRVNYYLNGGKMVSAEEMNKRLQDIRKKRKCLT